MAPKSDLIFVSMVVSAIYQCIVGFRPCFLPPVSSYIRFGLRDLADRSIQSYLPYIVKGCPLQGHLLFKGKQGWWPLLAYSSRGFSHEGPSSYPRSWSIKVIIVHFWFIQQSRTSSKNIE